MKKKSVVDSDQQTRRLVRALLLALQRALPAMREVDRAHRALIGGTTEKIGGPTSDSPATAVIDSLNAQELRQRLDQLDGERAALMILLRAARARERAAESSQQKAVDHARR